MDLTEKRAGVFASMQEAIDAGTDNWTSDDTARYAKMESEYKSLTERIEAAERFAKLSAPAGPTVPVIGGGVNAEQRTAEYRAAFDSFLRSGDLTSEQRALLTEARTMSTGIGSEGGYLVPDLTATELLESLKEFGGAARLASHLPTTSGSNIDYPTSDQTSIKGEIVAENEEAGSEDLAFGSKTLRAHTYSSKFVGLPINLIEDAAINSEQLVGTALIERIGRLQATHWIHGDGAGKPTGLVFGRDTGNDVQTSAAVAETALKDLVRKVDPAYRRLPGTAWLMNDVTAGVIAKIVVTDHGYLWPSETSPLLGYPVVIDSDMDDDATTGGGSHTKGVPVLFGNFNRAYIIRTVRGMAMVRDPFGTFAKKRQVGFCGFIRSDGMVKDTGAYAGILRNS